MHRTCCCCIWVRAHVPAHQFTFSSPTIYLPPATPLHTPFGFFLLTFSFVPAILPICDLRLHWYYLFCTTFLRMVLCTWFCCTFMLYRFTPSLVLPFYLYLHRLYTAFATYLFALPTFHRIPPPFTYWFTTSLVHHHCCGSVLHTALRRRALCALYHRAPLEQPHFALYLFTCLLLRRAAARRARARKPVHCAPDSIPPRTHLRVCSPHLPPFAAVLPRMDGLRHYRLPAAAPIRTAVLAAGPTAFTSYRAPALVGSLHTTTTRTHYTHLLRCHAAGLFLHAPAGSSPAAPLLFNIRTLRHTPTLPVHALLPAFAGSRRRAHLTRTSLLHVRSLSRCLPAAQFFTTVLVWVYTTGCTPRTAAHCLLHAAVFCALRILHRTPCTRFAFVPATGSARTNAQTAAAHCCRSRSPYAVLYTTTPCAQRYYSPAAHYFHASPPFCLCARMLPRLYTAHAHLVLPWFSARAFYLYTVSYYRY